MGLEKNFDHTKGWGRQSKAFSFFSNSSITKTIYGSRTTHKYFQFNRVFRCVSSKKKNSAPSVAVRAWSGKVEFQAFAMWNIFIEMERKLQTEGRYGSHQSRKEGMGL